MIGVRVGSGDAAGTDDERSGQLRASGRPAGLGSGPRPAHRVHLVESQGHSPTLRQGKLEGPHQFCLVMTSHGQPSNM